MDQACKHGYLHCVTCVDEGRARAAAVRAHYEREVRYPPVSHLPPGNLRQRAKVSDFSILPRKFNRPLCEDTVEIRCFPMSFNGVEPGREVFQSTFGRGIVHLTQPDAGTAPIGVFVRRHDYRNDLVIVRLYEPETAMQVGERMHQAAERELPRRIRTERVAVYDEHGIIGHCERPVFENLSRPAHDPAPRLSQTVVLALAHAGAFKHADVGKRVWADRAGMHWPYKPTAGHAIGVLCTIETERDTATGDTLVHVQLYERDA